MQWSFTSRRQVYGTLVMDRACRVKTPINRVMTKYERASVGFPLCACSAWAAPEIGATEGDVDASLKAMESMASAHAIDNKQVRRDPIPMLLSEMAQERKAVISSLVKLQLMAATLTASQP